MARSTIHDYLNLPVDWPVKENIKHEIVLFPNTRDIKKAKKSDPQACALHNAACRMFDIPNCAIGGNYAYIPQRDAKGKYYIARVASTAETRKAIKVFDKTGKMPEGGFHFVPLTASTKLDEKKKYFKKWAKGEVGVKNNPAAKASGGKKKKMTKQRRIVPLRSMPRSFAIAAR
jgi:hypothetical protein